MIMQSFGNYLQNKNCTTLYIVVVGTIDAFRQSVEYITCNYEFQKCLTRVFTKLHERNTFASITVLLLV